MPKPKRMKPSVKVPAKEPLPIEREAKFSNVPNKKEERPVEASFASAVVNMPELAELGIEEMRQGLTEAAAKICHFIAASINPEDVLKLPLDRRVKVWSMLADEMRLALGVPTSHVHISQYTVISDEINKIKKAIEAEERKLL